MCFINTVKVNLASCRNYKNASDHNTHFIVHIRLETKQLKKLSYFSPASKTPANVGHGDDLISIIDNINID